MDTEDKEDEENRTNNANNTSASNNVNPGTGNFEEEATPEEEPVTTPE